jgi:hypothetical protein
VGERERKRDRLWGIKHESRKGLKIKTQVVVVVVVVVAVVSVVVVVDQQ